MHSASFDHIDDVSMLRSLLIERDAQLIEREALLLARDAKLEERNAALRERDALIAAQARTVERMGSQIDYKTAKIAKLTAEIARLRRLQFSVRSEKLNPEQRELFEETMAADIAAVEAELDALQNPSSSPKPRKLPVRRALPPELPRVETVHEPEGCACGRCVGDLVKVGEHVRETLECEPLKFFVRREVYPQYACRACETVVAEPVPPAILDRSIAAPGLMAFVITSKYVDHLPLYRLEAMFKRSGVEMGRNTLAEWVGAVGVRLQPLVDAMRLTLHGCDVLHADETPVAQLDPGAGKTKRAYLFAYRSADETAPIVIFDYRTSRSGKHAGAFLDGWQGALMVDDYAGYKALFKDGAIAELGCWAHARRKFFDLHKANKSEIAAEALQRIAALYAVEQQAREMSAEDRRAYRQQHAKPRVNAWFEWLIKLRPTIAGNSGTANAIDYSLKRKAALTRYLDDGRYPIDNNPIENAIRPIALGRKNWLFAGSETAGKRAAAIMSLLATAKANGHCPHAWLTDVLTRLPTTLDKDIAALLPHRWRPEASM